MRPSLRRVLVVAVTALFLLSPSAYAAGGDDHGSDMKRGGDEMPYDNGDERPHTKVRTVDYDGVEPVQFVSLLIAGFALVAAVTALVYGQRRAPQ